MLDASRELLRLIRAHLSRSVVFVARGDRPVQIGFFVSSDGLVCTCYHGLLYLKPLDLTVLWGTHKQRATKVDQEGDYALLQVELPTGARSDPMPVLTEPFTSDALPCLAASLGGRQRTTTPRAVRLFPGSITAMSKRGEPERLETLDLSIGKGHSGAPIFDFHTLRVVAYVQSSVPQRMGEALTLRPLLERQSKLRPDWEAAGEALDRVLAPYYKRRPAELDFERCPIRLARSFYETQEEPGSSVWLADAGGLHPSELPAFNPRLYVERAIERQIRHFLSAQAESLLLLTGATGAGKTTLLTALARRSSSDCTFLFIACRTIAGADLIAGLPGAQAPERSGLDNLRLLMKREPDRKWVLIFDGLNEWPSFSRDAFWAAALALDAAANDAPPGSLKVIFCLRSELMREQFQGLYFWKSPRFGGLERTAMRMFYADESLGCPYLALAPLSASTLEDGRVELDVMYERYRDVGAFSSARRVGLGGRPITTADQLGPTIRSLLDRPAILPLFMAAYDRREVPNLTTRHEFLRRIIDAVFRRIPDWGEVAQAGWERYLCELALALTRAPSGNASAYHALRTQPRHDPKTLQMLLRHTSLLAREARGADIDEDMIAFSEEWLLEYFLAGALWPKCFASDAEEGDTLEARLDYLDALSLDVERRGKPTHLLAALVLCAERALDEDGDAFEVAAAWINRASSSLSAGFTHELLDSVRINGGLAPTAGAPDRPGRMAERFAATSRYFTAIGAARLLDYIEHLEMIGAYRHALALLALDDACFAPGGKEASVRRSLCRALCTFYANEAGVESHLRALAPGELGSSEIPKWNFVAGRLHQFRRHYQEAARLFEEGARGQGLFAARCAHQLAFIKVIASSDFIGARADLERLITEMEAWTTPEERLESRLLRGTCDLRLGRYREAEDDLLLIVDLRRRQRHRHKQGTALRSLAEVHLRRFEYEPAARRLAEGLEALASGEHALSRAYLLDVQALALCLLKGDMDRARKCNEEALCISREGRYDPGTRWYLQTAALLDAIDGEVDGAERRLAEADPERGSPYEKLQARFIAFIARWIADASATEEWIEQINELKADFDALRLAWYPGVLSLMLLAGGSSSPEEADFAAYFGGPLDGDGLKRSHLFARIFAARRPPTAA